ncbi:MAG: hypothetical protein HPY74_17365 [Firmicutes bacterium]|nr:hypothetical protein [Desulfobacterales bacterium]NSW92406.1 hypothetical protein [Bacillota bacterium]
MLTTLPDNKGTEKISVFFIVLERKVIVFRIIRANVNEYVSGLDNEIKFHDYKFKELADYWKERYMKNSVSAKIKLHKADSDACPGFDGNSSRVLKTWEKC